MKKIDLSKLFKKKKTKKSWFKNLFKGRGEDSFNTFEVVLIIFVSVLFGVIVGCIISSTRLGLVGDEISTELEEVITTYDNIMSEYYDEVDEKELMNAAISGMVSILDDPYSTYLDSNSTYNFNQSVDGEYVGLGITITWLDGICTITEVNKDAPAYKQGLKVGDIITAVDYNDVTKSTLDEISGLLTGAEGSEVVVTVNRNGETKEFKVKRAVIEIESVSGKVIESDDNKVGYIDIDTFASNTYNQFVKQLKTLEKKDIDSLIIDVRCNSGGRLSQVNKILDEFLDKKVEIYRIETKGKVEKIYTENKTKRSYPVVVLVNDGSASASEILATAFNDKYKNATIVGTTTYGKSSIQKAVELSSGSSVKYTIQKWLTSKGKDLQGKGLKPDVEVQQGEAYCDDLEYEKDTQLKKAVEILTNK